MDLFGAMKLFVAVVDGGRFAAAADKLAISRAMASKQIQKLEELLEVVLFDRSKKPVLTTPEGIPVLAQMRAILRETERLAQVVAEGDTPAGRYRLGVIPSLSPTVLPLFLARFATSHPRVELVVEELKTDEIITRLRADTLDAGLAATPLGMDGFTEVALGLEPRLRFHEHFAVGHRQVYAVIAEARIERIGEAVDPLAQKAQH